MEDPKKMVPKVIFNVENEITNEKNLMKELYVNSTKTAGVNVNEFKERERIVSRTNRKGLNVGNVVIDMSKRNVLVFVGRVCVKWRACKVKSSFMFCGVTNVLLSRI